LLFGAWDMEFKYVIDDFCHLNLLFSIPTTAIPLLSASLMKFFRSMIMVFPDSTASTEARDFFIDSRVITPVTGTSKTHILPWFADFYHNCAFFSQMSASFY